MRLAAPVAAVRCQLLPIRAPAQSKGMIGEREPVLLRRRPQPLTPKGGHYALHTVRPRGSHAARRLLSRQRRPG
eukprot:5321139-Prymnesium_polylepis.2